MQQFFARVVPFSLSDIFVIIVVILTRWSAAPDDDDDALARRRGRRVHGAALHFDDRARASTHSIFA